jgi:hypothetical protein
MRIFLALLVLIATASALADESTRGYYRRDGAYVAPSHRSSPNNRLYDNYNSQGNTNPYTGQRGYERNEFSTPPAYQRSSPNYPRYDNNPYQDRPYGQQPRRR